MKLKKTFGCMLHNSFISILIGYLVTQLRYISEYN